MRSLVESFFAAYQKADVQALRSLWSAKSPDLAAFVQQTQQSFAEAGNVEVRGIAVRDPQVDAGKATVRVAVEMSAVGANGGSLAEGGGKMNRSFSFVSEDGQWKIWRYAASEEELASALVAAKTEQERGALLEAEKELQTVALRQALIEHGERLLRQGTLSQASDVFRFVRRFAEQIGDRVGAATALSNIGVVYDLEGDNAVALEHYRKALAEFEALGDQPGIARSLLRIGVIHRIYGDYTQALDYYQQSLKLSEASGDKKGIAAALHNIGSVHGSLGDYAQALEYFRDALKLREKLGDESRVAGTLYNFASVYLDQGNYARALELFQRVLTRFEALNDKGGIASTLNSIGLVHDSQGNYAQALEYYQKSLALTEAKGSKRGVAIALHNIGSVHGSLGDHAQALKYFQKSLTLSEGAGGKLHTARALNSIGVAHRALGNYVQALEFLRKSLTLSEALGTKLEIIRALNNSASVYGLQGDHLKAVEFADRAATIAAQVSSPDGLRSARTTAGKAYRALGQLDKAHQAFADAINTIEKMRHQVAGGEQSRQRFFEDKLAPYHGMINLLVESNRLSEAFAYAERTKARVLLDVLRGGRVNITKAMTAQEQAHERSLNSELIGLNSQLHYESQRPQPDQRRLADLRARLKEARLAYEVFQNNLYAVHPALKVQRGEAQPLTLEDAAALLPDTKTALLEFVVGEEKSYLFVLSKSNQPGTHVDLKVYPLTITSKELVELTGSFRQMLEKRDLTFRQGASQLYDLLLKPAEQQLAHKTALCIVPDGVLWDLPFQALQPRPGAYLISDYALSYTPSLSVLRESARQKDTRLTEAVSTSQRTSPAGVASNEKGYASSATTPRPVLLAIGNPQLNPATVKLAKAVNRDEALGPLPEAEREVKSLAQLYGPADSRIYIGAEAREAVAKAEAGRYRVLHFATHSTLDDRNPMYSRLLLSQIEGDTNNDGLLEAWEIMRLDLRAELAVLSACQTARGRVGAGEGVIGMTWALFVAGVPTSVVSQWKVESASTADLMVQFHRNLLAGSNSVDQRMSKAEALRRAAIKMLGNARTRHPFYWAGFVIVGDGG